MLTTRIISRPGRQVESVTCSGARQAECCAHWPVMCVGRQTDRDKRTSYSHPTDKPTSHSVSQWLTSGQFWGYPRFIVSQWAAWGPPSSSLPPAWPWPPLETSTGSPSSLTRTHQMCSTVLRLEKSNAVDLRIITFLRKAFIKKKKKIVTFGRGGGVLPKNVKIFKVVFKIHFRPFWVILVKKNFGWKWGGSQYLANFRQFLDFENFYKCLTFLGGKKHFFSKSAPIMV